MRPFSSGGQFGDWTSSNCDRCTKGAHRLEPTAMPDCPLELALGEAYIGDGNITDEIAERMGCDPGLYGWQCTEWEPTAAWEKSRRALAAVRNIRLFQKSEAQQ